MNIKVYGVEQGVTQLSEVQVTNAGKRSQVPLEMAIGPKHFVFFMPPLVLIHCSLYISTLWEGLLGMEQHLSCEAVGLEPLYTFLFTPSPSTNTPRHT